MRKLLTVVLAIGTLQGIAQKGPSPIGFFRAFCIYL